MRHQVFIVEGQHDAAKLKEVLGNVDVITTNGSEISEETLTLIQTLDQTHDLVIFTDPDYAGERIRKLISKDLTHVYHAFLNREVAFSKNKKKIGIEHASKKDILESLSDLQLERKDQKSEITMAFLYDNQLIGHHHSKSLREKIAKQLNLGHVNGKTLKARLQLFNITQQNVKEVMDGSST